jgi:hypothetical protein
MSRLLREESCKHAFDTSKFRSSHYNIMITIIIASVDPIMITQIKHNIDETIGTPYELLIFHNDKGEESLASIYNRGTKMARYELLCFVHEDVLFNSAGWGNTIVEIFRGDQKLGLLGVAGGSYKNTAPTRWFHLCPHQQVNYLNLVQGYKNALKASEKMCHNPSGLKLAPVAVLDGVLMFSKKTIIQTCRFDEQLLKGFHGYDLDISLSVGSRFKVAVSYEIEITHFSEGSFENTWIDESILLHQKWKKTLPSMTVPLNKKETVVIEEYALRFFLQKMQKADKSMKQQFNIMRASQMPGISGWIMMIRVLKDWILQKL